MRLVTYRQNIESEARLGATDGDWVVDLQKFGSAYGLSIPSTMLGFIDLGPQASTILGPLVGKINGLYRSEEHTSELQSLMRNSYAVFCLKKNNKSILYDTTSTKHTHKINSHE